MLLYLLRLKELSGSKSHFFEHPEEVWRWLEMWDKVAPDRPERAGSVTGCVSNLDDSDWRNRRENQMEGSTGWGASDDGRLEIQQDGTMEVVSPGLSAGLTVTPDLGVEMIPIDS
ncbi:hypothetical protein NDU88_010282 [Pleurodeles waltl]|uniref:Uncharacterized protein n=1 Tax=Pleurodeles waltl TaxID=8319 RepID=A0AAV7QXT3_PLEWA|nr:hypothetical protein NDU88_010282 [Pleurodeles waltl]